MFSFLKHPPTPPTPKHHQPKLAAVSVASAQFKFVVGKGNLYFPWQQDGEPTAPSTPTPSFFLTQLSVFVQCHAVACAPCCFDVAPSLSHGRCTQFRQVRPHLLACPFE